MCNSCNKTIIKNYNYSCASRPNLNCECIATLNSKCINYYGNALESFNVLANTNTPLETILISINEAFGNISTAISVEDTPSISLSGTGTIEDPLTATLLPTSVETLYTADGSISSNRTVTVNNSTLQFTYPVQGTFEVMQNNADPNYATLLRIRNGGGGSGFIASVNSDNQYLKLGQYGSELKGADGSINFATGITLDGGVGGIIILDILSAPYLTTNVSGKVVAGTPMVAIADATDATDLLAKFNTLLAELRSAGLLLP